MERKNAELKILWRKESEEGGRLRGRLWQIGEAASGEGGGFEALQRQSRLPRPSPIWLLQFAVEQKRSMQPGPFKLLLVANAYMLGAKCLEPGVQNPLEVFCVLYKKTGRGHALLLYGNF
jgi:hypothetical protein